ncbi:SO_0444 family Cu/Zn efflux transporter [Celerinatantimonas sp. YJH-8]|uniref:SO_0444 family Cu/Zn efflux transporter n=1 Tax=Celerinatantimonas sp. YJH-8 TaxID=3228714 RepID=UPI0038C7093E
MILWNNFVSLFIEAAPWLLFGYLLAAVIKYGIPAQWMARHLGDQHFTTILKAALIGAPLPLCSCGVLPAALGLRRGGASKSATTAFLISTPETGVDSIAISYALLGPVLAITRPIAAIASAIVAGTLVSLDQRSQPKKMAVTQIKAPLSPVNASASPLMMSSLVLQPQPDQTSACHGGCCSAQDPHDEHGCHDDCCGKETSAPHESPLWKRIFSFAFGSMVAETYKWLVVGLIFAAIIQSYLPASWLEQWGSGGVAMLIMAVIGVPMYICATGSTPLAAGFLIAGISPGAVLVFLLAGPATNIATLALIRKEMGLRVLSCYLTGVIGTAFIFGAGLDQLVAYFHWTIRGVMHGSSLWDFNSIEIILSCLLAFLMIRAFVKEPWFPLRKQAH